MRPPAIPWNLLGGPRNCGCYCPKHSSVYRFTVTLYESTWMTCEQRHWEFEGLSADVDLESRYLVWSGGRAVGGNDVGIQQSTDAVDVAR